MRLAGENSVIDLRILILGLACVSAVNTCVAFFLFYWYKLRGVALWGIGTGVLSVGLFMTTMRGHLTDFSSIVLANIFILVGYGIVWGGMRQFVGKPRSTIVPLTTLIICGIAGTGFHLFSAVWPSLDMRVQVSAFSIFLFSFFVAESLLSYGTKNKAVFLTGLLYGLNGLVNVFRCALVLAFPAMKPFLLSGAFFHAFFIFSIILNVGMIVGQIYMVKSVDGDLCMIPADENYTRA